MGIVGQGRHMKQSGASAQQRQASEPRINAWVAANAGSGKTRVLVDRVIRLLLDGVEPERILCLTFTKAAAAEMANRLFEQLGQWIRLDDTALGAAISALGVEDVGKALLDRARTLFTVSLETPGGLKIQTIHAFCERLLQLFPVEAGVAPGFEVMDDRQVQEMLELARREVLTEAQSEASGGLSQALLKIIFPTPRKKSSMRSSTRSSASVATSPHFWPSPAALRPPSHCCAQAWEGHLA
jgi:ATP-dependent helicase/nuclease subunit A